jgi:hypothetical protein
VVLLETVEKTKKESDKSIAGLRQQCLELQNELA